MQIEIICGLNNIWEKRVESKKMNDFNFVLICKLRNSLPRPVFKLQTFARFVGNLGNVKDLKNIKARPVDEELLFKRL